MIADPIEREFVAMLRGEVRAFKDCFNQYLLGSLIFVATAYGLLGAVIKDLPYVAAIAIPLTHILGAVARIGTHKYATVNRDCAYELHLARTRDYPDSQSSHGWKRSMRSVDWEIALRAWRIVQPTIFRCLYTTPQESRWGKRLERWHFGGLNALWPGYYQPSTAARHLVRQYRQAAPGTEVSQRSPNYPWWRLDSLVGCGVGAQEPQAKYYAGSYLRNMFSLLEAMQVFLILAMPVACVFLWRQQQYRSFWFMTVGAIVLLVLAVLRAMRIKRRRKLLENELLSIHSCAILWQVVVLAHFKATERSTSTLEHYTEHLLAQAQALVDGGHVFHIHRWIKGDCDDDRCPGAPTFE